MNVEFDASRLYDRIRKQAEAAIEAQSPEDWKIVEDWLAKRRSQSEGHAARDRLTKQFAAGMGWGVSDSADLFGSNAVWPGNGYDHPIGFFVKGRSGRGALVAMLAQPYGDPPLELPEYRLKPWSHGDVASLKNETRHAAVMRLPRSWHYPGRTSAWLAVRLERV